MKEQDMMIKEWDKIESHFPDKTKIIKKVYCALPNTRVVFSSSTGVKIIDIEDIAENNIRLVDKEEAKWLIEMLEEYILYVDGKPSYKTTGNLEEKK